MTDTIRNTDAVTDKENNISIDNVAEKHIIQNAENKKTLFSGIQPTGVITLGNYIGAIQNWKKLIGEYSCIFSVVDLHSITVTQNPAELRKNTLELIALYIACGLDPDVCTLFVQSHVPAHAELAWVLNTITYIGEISRMTQFKDKSRSHKDNINMGLMSYPVLMAADILLYGTDIVPVGADQKQHLELARDLAERFNSKYSPTFTVPQPYIAKQGAKIMSLQNPLSKMSKSDENINGFVALTDDADTIMRKFKRAVTDSDNQIKTGKGKEGVTNLLTIYSSFTGKSITDAEREFEGKGYGDFKVRVGEVVIEGIKPIQLKQKQLLSDKQYLADIVKNGAEKATKLARKTLNKVYRKVGFYGF